MISKEQSEKIKASLLQQITNSNQENKEQIIEYIEKLNEDELEQFLKQNKINPEEPENEKPVFEQIIDGKIPSYKIAENKKAIAILEINPLSRGHSIILPKQNTNIERIPKTAIGLAQKIAKRIRSKLKPDDIKIETFSFQGYSAINIIPLYKDAKLEKRKASEQELVKLKEKLEIRKRQRIKREKEIKQASTFILKIPKRIP